MSDLQINELGIFIVILMVCDRTANSLTSYKKNPFLQYPEHQSHIIPRLSVILTSLSSKERLEFQSITNDSVRADRKSTVDPSHLPPTTQASGLFQKIITTLHMFINIKLLDRDSKEDADPIYKDYEIINAAQTLEIFYILNEISKFVPYYEFYNERIEQTIDLKDDYPRWKGKDG